ncbi:TM2 domain-containing protein [Litorimonas sp. RW-G-Af-16]|uniref:TM2 domain-containing protein n=1 Tax=Litorimonas sp. RW-G-Af-16 TaxID=3241168 RepID=UPI00390CACB1
MDRHHYDREIVDMAASLTEGQRYKFMELLQREALNPVEVFGWNMWLGWLGIDRFIVGDIVLGVFKLITLGGLGIWQIVDCFLIGNRARDKNYETALDIYEHVKATRG